MKEATADGKDPFGTSVAPKTVHSQETADAPRTERLAQLFDDHAEFLVRVVTRSVGTRDRAEDVVQRAFLIAHRKGLPDIEPDHARAWLYRVAMNEVQHERRSLARRTRLASSVAREPQPEAERLQDDVMVERDRARLVREIVADLPDAQREVFTLYELEEMPGQAIAEMLEIPENTVWSRLRLARQRFEKIWRARVEDRA